MLRVVAVGIALVFLAGCTDPAAQPEAAGDAAPEVVVDANRARESFGDVVTGPAVGPDLNATTAAAPRLVEGEWWRIRFDGGIGGQQVEVVRVVADANEEGYIVGMPHEGWLKETIAFHSPAFGDVNFDLSYDTHNERFEPVRFPLEHGATWETRFALGTYIATVTQVDEFAATIEFTAPEGGPDGPLEQVAEAAGLGGSSNGPAMMLTYDARQHEIVHMESFVGVWEVVEHGYDFEGWVTVPRGEHTAIDYGYFGGPVGVPGVMGDHTPVARKVTVEGGFNRMTMMHLVVPLPTPAGVMMPGKYSIKDTTPNGTVFLTETMNELVIRFYEASEPDGEWTVEDTIAGVGATYSMGIAYHQYDIRLPDGLRRTDHSHAVIR